MGKSTISMAIFNSFLLTFTRPGNDQKISGYHPIPFHAVVAWWSPRCQHKMLRSAPSEALPSGFSKHLKGRSESEANALRWHKGHKGHNGENPPRCGFFLGGFWWFVSWFEWWCVRIFKEHTYAYVTIDYRWILWTIYRWLMDYMKLNNYYIYKYICIYNYRPSWWF